MAKYTLDTEDQTLLEEVFNLAQRVVDLQVDDDSAEELQELLNASAELFGITQAEVIVEDDGEGTVRITFAEAEDKSKHSWTPTVITNEDVKPKPEG